MREKIQQMNYTTWFHPSVTIITEDSAIGNSEDEEESNVIEYGDYLHTDFGVTALGLNTDTQHLGYVLYPGQTEKDVPKGLREGLKKGNRLQDIVKSNMVIGRTGNEILKTSLDQMHREGIEGKIYCHPIGDWGHAAGTLVGKLNPILPRMVLGSDPCCLTAYLSPWALIRHDQPPGRRSHPW